MEDFLQYIYIFTAFHLFYFFLHIAIILHKIITIITSDIKFHLGFVFIFTSFLSIIHKI